MSDFYCLCWSSRIANIYCIAYLHLLCYYVILLLEGVLEKLCSAQWWGSLYTRRNQTLAKNPLKFFSGGYGEGEGLVNIFVLYSTDIIVHIDIHYILLLSIIIKMCINNEYNLYHLTQKYSNSAQRELCLDQEYLLFGNS